MEWLFCYGIGNCSYSSGISTRIALAILGVQSAGFALFYGIGKCSYSSGISTRIALAILGVQSAGFALFYAIRGKKQCVSFTVSIVYCII